MFRNNTCPLLFGNKICNVRFSFFSFFFNLTIAYVDWELESWIFFWKERSMSVVSAGWFIRRRWLIGLPFGIGFHLVFELSDKQTKNLTMFHLVFELHVSDKQKRNLTMWNVFYWKRWQKIVLHSKKKYCLNVIFLFSTSFRNNYDARTNWMNQCCKLFGTSLQQTIPKQQQ